MSIINIALSLFIVNHDVLLKQRNMFDVFFYYETNLSFRLSYTYEMYRTASTVCKGPTAGLSPQS